MKRLIRRRYEALYRGLGIAVPSDLVGYYAILDLELLGTATYGRRFGTRSARSVGRFERQQHRDFERRAHRRLYPSASEN